MTKDILNNMSVPVQCTVTLVMDFFSTIHIYSLKKRLHDGFLVKTYVMPLPNQHLQTS